MHFYSKTKNWQNRQIWPYFYQNTHPKDIIYDLQFRVELVNLSWIQYIYYNLKCKKVSQNAFFFSKFGEIGAFFILKFVEIGAPTKFWKFREIGAFHLERLEYPVFFRTIRFKKCEANLWMTRYYSFWSSNRKHSCSFNSAGFLWLNLSFN